MLHGIKAVAYVGKAEVPIGRFLITGSIGEKESSGSRMKSRLWTMEAYMIDLS